MSELQFLKTLIFPAAFLKLQDLVNLSLSLYSSFLSVFIVNTYVRKRRLLLLLYLTK